MGRAVPPGFRFAAKASRHITHMKRLSEPGQALAQLLDRLEALGPKLGPVLLQLPPRWHVDWMRLRSFLDELLAGRRFAIEFRDPTWRRDEVFEILAERAVAFCVFDLRGHVSPGQITAPFVYIRLRGPGDPAYRGSYGPRHLAGWAGAISEWLRSGRDVYCYFNNDAEGNAPRDAATLADMLGYVRA